MGFLDFLFKDQNRKTVEKIEPIVSEIERLANSFRNLDRSEIQKKIQEKKEMVKDGVSLDEILPESFALTKVAAEKTLGQSHYPVQIIGGVVLHQGKIAEMKTGEGKTLTATLPLVLNSLTGKGVHLITVNDYLAKWQAGWMGKIYNFLGLSCGVITSDMDPEKKKNSYRADITYGTNNEIGFDYLRDNLATDLDEKVQRPFNFGIVDEVDSILIDEARTPLIISAPIAESKDLYKYYINIVRKLEKDVDYKVDEKERRVTLTEEGLSKVESMTGKNPYAEGVDDSHYLDNALKAHAIFKIDVDYIVKDGEVLIVDEFTGRILKGRRYSDGLHQAIEAKENVEVKEESRTLATISFQNLFRLYPKLAGMTGTAFTSAEEFFKVYNLEVVVIPTNKPMIRKDLNDRVYVTKKAKLKAILEEVKKRNKNGQPILIGTISVESSEEISDLLRMNGIKHNVLNAKNHAKEAEIIAQAGRIGQVTIATNMAGRGTDILLGGNPEEFARNKAGLISVPSIDELETKDPDLLPKIESYKKYLLEMEKVCLEEREKVIEAGGLCVIGTERHEARRIDDQLRGRAGRQGDPGVSIFFLSLEDDLLRIFGSDKLKNFVLKLGVDENEPLEHKMVSKSIESAQKRIEGMNFDIRKRLIEYDDVINIQRKTIYEKRDKILYSKSIKEEIEEDMSFFVRDILEKNFAKDKKNYLKSTLDELSEIVLIDRDSLEKTLDALSKEEQASKLTETLKEEYRKKREKYIDIWDEVERKVKLQIIDRLWVDHIDVMAGLLEGINLRSYGQKDPLQEYKREGFEMFQELISRIDYEVIKTLFRIEVKKNEDKESLKSKKVRMQTNADKSDGIGLRYKDKAGNINSFRNTKKPGRNDPCPCGSGKKYKKCCYPKSG